MQKIEITKINYNYSDLEPYISKEQLEIHHTKHHAAYVEAANNLLFNESLLPPREFSHKLAFNLGGAVLHDLFWGNLRAPKENNTPEGSLEMLINDQFDSFQNFKNKFTEMSLSIQGSGWTALLMMPGGKLNIIQIENHQNNIPQIGRIILVLDCWEHAYYLDYQNDKETYFENFFKIVNWETIEERYQNKKEN